MPIVDTKINVADNCISYTEWKNRSSNNRVRYFEYGSPATYYASFGKLGMILISKVVDSADILDFETNIKPSATSASSEIELVELCIEDALIGSLDGRQQKAYDITTTSIYTGYADFGVLQSESGWTIKKMELDVSGNPTSEKWTSVGVGIWTNRELETYI